MVDLRENLLKIGLALTVTKKAKVLITEKGFNLEFGVRFLRREIQSLVEDPLSELLLSKAFSNAKGIKIDSIKGQLEFSPIIRKPRKKTSKNNIKISKKKSKKSIDS